MRTLQVTQAEYDKLYELQVRRRPDCKPAFGANDDEQIWLFTTKEFHAADRRIHVRSESRMFGRVADI